MNLVWIMKVIEKHSLWNIDILVTFTKIHSSKLSVKKDFFFQKSTKNFEEPSPILSNLQGPPQKRVLLCRNRKASLGQHYYITIGLNEAQSRNPSLASVSAMASTISSQWSDITLSPHRSNCNPLYVKISLT